MNLNSYDRFIIFMVMLMYLNLFIDLDEIDFKKLENSCRECELRNYEIIDVHKVD